MYSFHDKETVKDSRSIDYIKETTLMCVDDFSGEQRLHFYTISLDSNSLKSINWIDLILFKSKICHVENSKT